MATGHLRAYIDNYLIPHPSRETRRLFTSRALLDLAAAASMLFEPIYLWSSGFSPAQVMLFFAGVYALYVLALPFGARICRRYGYEHAILFSSPFLIGWYAALLAIPSHPAFLLVAGVALVAQKILYWPGYHADFAARVAGASEGKGISTVAALAGLGAAFAPAVGGMIIALWGFPALFTGVIVLVILSNVPLLGTIEPPQTRPFGHGAAMSRLFAPARRQSLVAYMGIGEELFAIVAWPVFIAMMVPDARTIGALVSAAMLANAAVVLYVGRVSDGADRGGVLRIGTMHTALSWAVRPFITGGLGVFLVDTFYRTAKNMVNVPLLAGVYDDARRGDAVEEVVFFEMALALGKIAAALLAAAAFTWLTQPWTAIFAAGAAFTAAYSLLTRANATRP